MGSLRLRPVLIGTGVMLALGASGSTASAASGRPVAAAKSRAAPATAAGAPVGALGGTWGTAEEVPGTAALNKAGGAEVSSVSCASAGNCSAGGFYETGRPRSLRTHVFVVIETHGTWGTAEQVPGTAALNQGGNGRINAVSCASAGNCGAGGDYLDSSGHQQALVVSQAAGAWGKAIEVPGTAVLNQRGFAAIESVSCASAGVCSAGGYYKDGSGHSQAFVDSTT